jgi:hypothetical protein
MPCVSHLCTVYGHLLICNWDARLILLHSRNILCNSGIRFFFNRNTIKIPNSNSFPPDTLFFVVHLLLSRYSAVAPTLQFDRLLYFASVVLYLPQCPNITKNTGQAILIPTITKKSRANRKLTSSLSNVCSLKLLGIIFMSIFLHPHELYFLGHRREEFVGPVKTIHFFCLWDHPYEA